MIRVWLGNDHSPYEMMTWLFSGTEADLIAWWEKTVAQHEVDKLCRDFQRTIESAGFGLVIPSLALPENRYDAKYRFTAPLFWTHLWTLELEEGTKEFYEGHLLIPENGGSKIYSGRDNGGIEMTQIDYRDVGILLSGSKAEAAWNELQSKKNR